MLLLVGCGEQTGEKQSRSVAEVPTTPASLAYVAAEHVGEPDSANEGSNWSHSFGARPVEAKLRFGSTGEYDGDEVQVVVGRSTEDITDCAHLPYEVSGCEDLEDGLWYYGEAIPEEDPGGVFVVQRKGQVTVRVSYYGPPIEGDPREQDLPVDVRSLIDLAADPRLDTTTDPAAVEQGAKAAYWSGPRT